MRRTLITAGVLVDTNGNGLANALRGRGALLESQGVERVPMYSIELQVFFAETWQTVAVDDQDVVSVAGRRSWSTTPRCLAAAPEHRAPLPSGRPRRHPLDRRHLGTRTTVSQQFQARAVANSQVC